MAPDNTLACPKCRFRNRRDEVRCLMCKTLLPRESGVTQVRSRPEIKETLEKDKAKEKLGRATQRTSMSLPKPPGLTGASLADALPRPTTSKMLKGQLLGTPSGWLHCAPLPAIPLVGRAVTVGRQECDLVLPHKEVSRHHASFKLQGKQILIEDEGSSNGTFVNGKRVTSQNVKMGDVVTIGPYEIEICPTSAPAEAASDTSQFDLTKTSLGVGGSAQLSGRLQEVALTEILQQIEFNKRTGTLTIALGKRKGRIVLAEGRPLAANWEELVDEAAVRAMLHLTEGRFALVAEAETVEPSMRTTFTAILLDFSRERDEQADGSDDADEPPPVPGEETEAGATEEADAAPDGAPPPGDVERQTAPGESSVEAVESELRDEAAPDVAEEGASPEGS